MRYLPVLFFAGLLGLGLHAEASCPANFNSSIPFHNSQHYQIIVPVFINHSGPFQFLLDTGTQMTVIDQSLADELQLISTGNADVAGVSVHGHAEFAQVDTLEIGNHISKNQKVLVYNMNDMHRSGAPLSGLLGQDFLSRFNVLIDNEHAVVCIGNARAAQSVPQNNDPEFQGFPNLQRGRAGS